MVSIGLLPVWNITMIFVRFTLFLFLWGFTISHLIQRFSKKKTSLNFSETLLLSYSTGLSSYIFLIYLIVTFWEFNYSSSFFPFIGIMIAYWTTILFTNIIHKKELQQGTLKKRMKEKLWAIQGKRGEKRENVNPFTLFIHIIVKNKKTLINSFLLFFMIFFATGAFATRYYYTLYTTYALLGKDPYTWLASQYYILTYHNLSYKRITAYPRGFDLFISSIISVGNSYNYTYKDLLIMGKFFPIYNLFLMMIFLFLLGLNLFQKNGYLSLLLGISPLTTYFLLQRSFLLVPSILIDLNNVFIIYLFWKREQISPIFFSLSLAVSFLIHPLYALFLYIIFLLYFLLMDGKEYYQQHGERLRKIIINRNQKISLIQKIYYFIKEGIIGVLRNFLLKHKITIMISLTYFFLFAFNLFIHYREDWYTQYLIYFNLSLIDLYNFARQFAAYYKLYIYLKCLTNSFLSVYSGNLFMEGRILEDYKNLHIRMFIVSIVPIYIIYFSAIFVFSKMNLKETTLKNKKVLSKSYTSLMRLVKILLISIFIYYVLPDIPLGNWEPYENQLIYYYYRNRLFELMTPYILVFFYTYLYYFEKRLDFMLLKKKITLFRKKIIIDLRKLTYPELVKIARKVLKILKYIFLTIYIFNFIFGIYPLRIYYFSNSYTRFIGDVREYETQYIKEGNPPHLIYVDKNDEELCDLIRSQFELDHEIVYIDLSEDYFEFRDNLSTIPHGAMLIVSSQCRYFRWLYENKDLIEYTTIFRTSNLSAYLC